MINSVLLYCRAGFESDLAAEISDKSAHFGLFGYPRFEKSSGYVLFTCYQADDARTLVEKLDFNQLIFARQLIMATERIDDLDPQDRISMLMQHLGSQPQCGDVYVEYADTTEGREMSKFCRKFTVPLRQALRKKGMLTKQAKVNLPILHVFFLSGTSVHIGLSLPRNRSLHLNGIMRLKFPAAAPSRSTLKLDEAFQTFIPLDQQPQRLAAGMHAVDLGACPGGWTYQLVSRGMFVQAVDNGSMDEALMESGQVSYFAEDGFKYQPKKKKVYWLVCDMIEQPQRVAQLMAKWLQNGWCKETIFNLKLPMKQRYQSVMQAKQVIDKVMQGTPYQWQAKHLYHDREEITVHLRLA